MFCQYETCRDKCTFRPTGAVQLPRGSGLSGLWIKLEGIRIERSAFSPRHTPPTPPIINATLPPSTHLAHSSIARPSIQHEPYRHSTNVINNLRSSFLHRAKRTTMQLFKQYLLGLSNGKHQDRAVKNSDAQGADRLHRRRIPSI